METSVGNDGNETRGADSAQESSGCAGPLLPADSGPSAPAAVVAARVVEQAYQALVDAAQYPSLPDELTHGFLSGVEAAALSTQEKAALQQEYDADLRLTGLLDQLFTALRSRQAKLLVKDKALHDLIGVKDGLRSFTDFRGLQSGKGARAAAQELDTAQTLVKTPSAQEAVDNGEITLDHVGALSKAASTVARRGEEFTPTEEAELVQLGKGSTTDEYQKMLSRYVNGRNPLAHDASHAQIRRRRFLHVSHTPVGAHIKGFLDPVSAQTLQIALEAATPKPAKDDDRDYGQRNADALEAIASLALNTGELKTGALVRPHLSFIMTEKTYLDATKELQRRRSLTQAPVDRALLEPVAMEPAEFEDGTTIPLNELTRLMCDASVTRIVLNAKNAPLNVGRTERYYTKELRRAIIARDKSCRFAGCTMEARWSEVHHIQWWDKDDGETSIENGILCCKFHHTQIHDGILQVTHDHNGLPQIILAKTKPKEPNEPQDQDQDHDHQESPSDTDPPHQENPPGQNDQLGENDPPGQHHRPPEKPKPNVRSKLDAVVRTRKESRHGDSLGTKLSASVTAKVTTEPLDLWGGRAPDSNTNSVPKTRPVVERAPVKGDFGAHKSATYSKRVIST